MTRFGLNPRRVRDDDAVLDALANRQPPPAGSDDAVRLLADIGAAADEASGGVPRGAGGDSRFVATRERSARPALAWAAAAAAAAVVAVALGTVAPPSSPRPRSTDQTTQVSPVSLTRARELTAAAEGLLRPTGPLVEAAARDRARALLREARTELQRARSADEGQPAERDEVERFLTRTESMLTESEGGLAGLDDGTGTPAPTPTESDDDQPHGETDGGTDAESSTGGADEGTPSPGAGESSPDDD